MVDRRRCPECGALVKLVNLEDHLARVHPRSRTQLDLTDEERRSIARGKPARPPRSVSWRVPTAIALAAALALVGVAAWQARPTGGSGRFSVSPVEYDFGTIGQGVVSTTFTVRNTGAGDLVLQGISTSCMCTTATFVYEGVSSPTFGFHGNPSWSLRLPAGAVGSLVVAYDPAVHPELGHFMREIYILSSDPVAREVTVRIHVNEV